MSTAGIQDAADAVSWSRVTLYRYLKQYGDEAPAAPPAATHGRGRSQYAATKKLPARR